MCKSDGRDSGHDRLEMTACTVDMFILGPELRHVAAIPAQGTSKGPLMEDMVSRHGRDKDTNQKHSP